MRGCQQLEVDPARRERTRRCGVEDDVGAREQAQQRGALRGVIDVEHGATLAGVDVGEKYARVRVVTVAWWQAAGRVSLRCLHLDHISPVGGE